jgi:molybdopterin-guanine dinucleotide biosynthesis protein B
MATKNHPAMIPLIKIVGVKNSGKTTLAEKLIRTLSRRGFKVAGMKHASHAVDLDRAGTDSSRLSRAGALATCLINPEGFWIYGRSTDRAEVASYFRAVARNADIILSEGDKKGAGPKIEINRRASREGPLCLEDEELIALVTDRPGMMVNRPVFHPDDIDGIADFIEARYLHQH